MTPTNTSKPSHASREEIELLYTHLLSRIPTKEEIDAQYAGENSVNVLLKVFLISPEFINNKINITERLEAVARAMSAHRNTDWLSAKVHVTGLYLKYCDWTRFVDEAADALLVDPMVDGATQQETRLLVWMVQAHELYDQLKDVDRTYKSYLDDMAWRFRAVEGQIAQLAEKMERVIQHSPEGDRALLTEILLRLDRLSDTSPSVTHPSEGSPSDTVG